MNTKWIPIEMVKQLDLREHLVRERATHHKARMTGCTSNSQASLRKDNHLMTIIERPDIGSRLQLITNRT